MVPTSTNARRLHLKEFSNTPGVVCEVFGPVMVVQYHQEKAQIPKNELKTKLEACIQNLGIKSVYLKEFLQNRAEEKSDTFKFHRDSNPFLGSPSDEKVLIFENDMHFITKPYDGFSVGIFLDQRDNRLWVKKNSKNKKILNLFSYTCGFSVSAACGGASEVTSIDISKKYLDWGKENFEVNNQDPGRFKFVCSDSMEYLNRANQQDKKYDLIIIDPPTFSRQRRPKKNFEVERELDLLFKLSISCLAPSGVILFSTNKRDLKMSKILTTVENQTVIPKGILKPLLPVDFRYDPDFNKTVITQY